MEIKSSQFCFSRWLPFSLLTDGIGNWGQGSPLVGRYPHLERPREYREKRRLELNSPGAYGCGLG